MVDEDGHNRARRLTMTADDGLSDGLSQRGTERRFGQRSAVMRTASIARAELDEIAGGIAGLSDE